MRVLALRMAPAGPEVALLGGTSGPVQRECAGARAEAFAPLLAASLTEAGLRFADLDALAVLTGPGSFTASRGAVAAARALALATGLRVHALSSLELAAETVAESGSGPLTVVAPAGRGMLAVQRFEDGAVPAGPPESLAPAAAIALAATGERVVLVDLEAWSGPAVCRTRTSALALARVAVARAARGIPALPGTAVRPLYIRPPDARAEAGRPLVAAA